MIKYVRKRSEHMVLTSENYNKLTAILGADISRKKEINGAVIIKIADLFNEIVKNNCANDFEVSLTMKRYNEGEDKYKVKLLYVDLSKDYKGRRITFAETIGATATEALNNFFGENIVQCDLKVFDNILGNQTESIMLSADEEGGLNAVLYIPSFRDVDHATSGEIDVSAGRYDFEIENKHIEQIFLQLKKECEKLNLNSLNVWGKKGRSYSSYTAVDLSPIRK